MATLLVIVIYIAFIGLGVPDSLFGTAWPAIYTELNLPLSTGSIITIINCCASLISSLNSARLIRRFGTNYVTAVSTLLTALALLAFSFSGNFWTLCLSSIPLGLGAGAIDTALNNYVALHYSATHMSFLHCFYGVGITISPYILAIVLRGESGWRGGYRVAFVLQLVISAITILAIPLWKKVHGKAQEEAEKRATILPFKELLKLPGIKATWCVFLSSCAVELTCGGWGSTYLVEYKNVPVEIAAELVLFYYLGMTLGRFFSGLLAKKWSPWRIIITGECIVAVALLLLLLPLPATLSAIGFFLVGLGNGPLFPNFNYLTPKHFGEENSQHVMGTQMVAAYVGIMVIPALFGVLGQKFGMWLFPIYLLIFYLFMLAGTFSLYKDKQGRT